MSRIASMIAASADILVLQPDEASEPTPPTPDPGDAFETAPFATPCHAALGGRSRMVEEAADWALCRSRRLRMEEQIALQEEFRILKPEQAEDIRARLSQVERRVGEAPVEHLLRSLTILQRRLYADGDEAEWW